MLNENIAKLDDYFLFMAYVLFLLMIAIFKVALWSDFKVELLVILIFAKFVRRRSFNLDINAAIGSDIWVTLFVAQLIFYHLVDSLRL